MSPRLPQLRTTTIAAIAVTLAFVTAGCTTSRAIRAWHRGVAHEQAGDVHKATRAYGEAYGRNNAHFGAELARLRLLARSPDSRKRADEDLQKLLKKKGTLPDVALFAAWWALLGGDTAGAQERIKALAIPAKHRSYDRLAKERARLQAAVDAQVERERQKRDGAKKSAFAQQQAGARLLRDGQPRAARDVLAGLVASGQDNSWQSRFNLGIAELSVGNMERAHVAFAETLKRNPACEGARRNLAVLTGAGGNPRAADRASEQGKQP